MKSAARGPTGALGGELGRGARRAAGRYPAVKVIWVGTLGCATGPVWWAPRRSGSRAPPRAGSQRTQR